jgi:peptidoglycan hydrolase CwlO-like protein
MIEREHMDSKWMLALKRVGVVVLAVALSVGVASCSSDDNPDEVEQEVDEELNEVEEELDEIESEVEDELNG